MDWQEIVALGIVFLTVTIFAVRRFKPRKRRFDFRRDTHCGCSSPATSAPGASIIYHARKGERGEIIMKLK